jgi:penicillin-binding protein
MRMIKILICVLAVLLLAACTTNQEPTYDITSWLDALKAMDFEALWAQVEPAVSVDKESFIEKYDNIFSGLGVKEITFDNISGPDENGCFTYTATYKTEEYGDFTNDYSLQMVWNEEGNRVFWNYSLIFPDMEEGSVVRIKTLRATRGEIFADDGTLLARNAYADTLYMDTTKVQDITAVGNVVCPLTELTQTELVDMFNKAQENGTQFVKLDAYFASELTETQKQSIMSVPGLGIDDKMYTPIRDYPLKESAAHILGYTGYPDPENLPEGYKDSDRLGVTGLEAAYETELRGKDGKIVYIENKWGDNVRTLWEVPMEEGQDLRLAIKPKLQEKAYKALETYLSLEEGQSGVAIVMDAEHGYVEAMAQYPSYDNNWFTFSLSQENLDYISSDERPLFSRVTQGLYPPGSVIKPFTATAALEGGVITADTVFDGQIVDNKWQPEEYHISVTRMNDKAGSPLKLANALRSSDNIYFAFAALQLGADKLVHYFKRIGFGQDMPFDLSVIESSAKNSATMMSNQLLATMGYGQGELVLAPIQLAAMYTAFANQTGDILQPLLVKKICRTDGLDYMTLSERDKVVWIEDAVSQQSLDTLTPMMQEVIRHGTGYLARIDGVSMAGKTGTAELGEDKSREISWFACYWLDGYYDRLVVVMVDVEAEKGPVKFDIAKELLAP